MPICVNSWPDYLYLKHIASVFLQGLLCGLVLHDGAAPEIKIIQVRVAEPVVDDHGEPDLRLVFGNCEGDGLFNDEVILVKRAVVGVLSNAEMNV